MAEVEKQTLTERQRECLLFIANHWAERGFGPSVRDIGEGLGITSPNGVMANINALVKKGYLVQIEPNGGRYKAARSIIPVGLLQQIKEASAKFAEEVTNYETAG